VIFNDMNEFEGMNHFKRGFELGARVITAHGEHKFKTTLLLGPDGRIDVSNRSNEELVLTRAILRDLPPDTVARLHWSPAKVIADIDAELARRRDEQ
jgi:hypothetical protein